MRKYLLKCSNQTHYKTFLKQFLSAVPWGIVGLLSLSKLLQANGFGVEDIEVW